MITTTTRPSTRFLLCLLLLATIPIAASPAHGQDGGDRLLVTLGSELWDAHLPRGDFAVQGTIQEEPEAIAFGPDGRLFALGLHYPPITAPPYVALVTLGEGGVSTLVTEVGISPFESILDMAFAPGGQLYVLVYGFGIGDPPSPEKILYQLDLENGDIVAFHFVPEAVEAVASSPRGLWLLERDRLLHFDASTHRVRESGFSLGIAGSITGAATDSTGALWFITRPGNIDPTPSILRRFDPATGSASQRHLGLVPFGPLAAEQRCQNTETTRCLLGGRFSARVEWLDFDDRLGQGQVAPSGSADSVLFWFFEPSNWELLVKVIDGCDENGHFWVFAAGTTNVGHGLEVTDLATGETFTAINRIGQASPAVTATDAFDSCDF